MASNVEYAPVAIASIPARRYVGYGSRLQYIRIHDSPLGLSQVSHSLYLVTCSATVNTTTRRRNDTASHPRLHAMPRTLSRNSNSATSLPMASSHKMTLLGGYKGLGPPPTKNRRDDVWHGTTNCNVPPESSNIIESPGYIEAK